MPIRFHCGNCRTRIRVPDGSEGKDVKCPQCGDKRRVPGEPSAQPAKATAPIKAAPPVETPTPSKRKPPPLEDLKPPSVERAEQTTNIDDSDGPQTGPAAAAVEPPAPAAVEPVSVSPLAAADSEQSSEAKIESYTEPDNDLASVPEDQTRHDAADLADVVEAGPEGLADSQEDEAQPETIARSGAAADEVVAEPLEDQDAVEVMPAARATPVPPVVVDSQRAIPLSAAVFDQDVAEAASLGDAVPPCMALCVCSWLLWALSVGAILVAVGLVIWYPISLTGDAKVDLRLVLLGGVGVAALFWGAAELAAALRRSQQRNHRRT